MEIGNVGSWKRDEWIQWTFCWRDLWRIFSILDSIINQCHGQCEKCIRCHSFSISLSAFFSDVIFKIYTLVLFRIKKKSITDYKGTLKHDGAFFFFLNFRTVHMHTISFIVNHWKKKKSQHSNTNSNKDKLYFLLR